MTYGMYQEAAAHMLSIILFLCGSCNYAICQAGLVHAEYQISFVDGIAVIGVPGTNRFC